MNKEETKIIKASIKGKRAAQKALYDEHKVFLFGVCLHYAKRRAEAEDMLQEGFYMIFRDLKSYSGNSPLRAWMRKVMINCCLMHIRKHRKLEYLNMGEKKIEFKMETDTSLTDSHRANEVIALIQELPTAQQTVFNLRAIDGYSFKEIALMLDVNETTLRSYYLRARKKLQEMLIESLK